MTLERPALAYTDNIKLPYHSYSARLWLLPLKLRVRPQVEFLVNEVALKQVSLRDPLLSPANRHSTIASYSSITAPQNCALVLTTQHIIIL
jgi:hypothetical protein